MTHIKLYNVLREDEVDIIGTEVPLQVADIINNGLGNSAQFIKEEIEGPQRGLEFMVGKIFVTLSWDDQDFP